MLSLHGSLHSEVVDGLWFYLKPNRIVLCLQCQALHLNPAVLHGFCSKDNGCFYNSEFYIEPFHAYMVLCMIVVQLMLSV